MTDQSMENSKKLDEIIILLRGDGPDVPGVLTRLAHHEETLYGQRGNNGLVGKVNVMWRVHVWLLCSLSGFAGYMIKEFATKVK